jgi:hypothetical protein
MTKQTCPMSASEVLDANVLETRARLLEVAAMLDRVDRSGDAEKGRADYRYRALKEAIQILATGKESRARAILLALSDPTNEPLEKAGSKGAVGAWAGGR